MYVAPFVKSRTILMSIELRNILDTRSNRLL